MVELTVLSGPAGGREIAVGGERFVIGRDPSCDLVLDDSKVSRRHAYLMEHPGGGVEVGDLGSVNGTLVNGQRLTEPTRIAGGDEVSIGATRLAIAPAAAPAPVAAPAAGGEETEQAEAQTPQRQSIIRRAVSRSQRSSVVQRMRLERSVRRATLLAGGAVVVAVVAVVLAVSGVFSSESDSAPTTSQIVNTVKPSTVRVLSKVNGRTLSSGTGWVYDAAQGLIVTNAHVVGDQGGQPGLLTYSVVVGTQPRTATLYGDSPCYDLAMLKVDDTTGLQTLPLGSQATLEQGDQAIAIGYPGNEITNFGDYPLQSTSGTVSVVKESQQSRSEAAASDPDARLYPNLVQTDAAINHGNSGGPLVNGESQLIGVNTLGTLHTQQQGFAIGVDFAKQQAPILARNESIGFLGFDFVATGKYLVVRNAVKGSPAADVGFGNAPAAITGVDGTRVATRADYCSAVRDSQPGDKATLTGIDSAKRPFSVHLPFE